MRDLDAYQELRDIQQTPAKVLELEKKIAQLEAIHHNITVRIQTLELTVFMEGIE